MQKRALKRFACGFFALAVGLAFASPALAHRGSERHHHGGKRPIGEVSAFDGTTLSVLVYRSGETKSGTVDESTKIKLDHRGKPKTRGSNPTQGSVEDLVVGTKVLKLKLRDGAVSKVRVRTFETTECGNGQPDNGQIEVDDEEGEDDESETEDELESEGDDEGDTEGDELETEGDEDDEDVVETLGDHEGDTDDDELESESDEACGSDDDEPETEDSEDESDDDSEDESEEDDSDDDDSDDDLLDAVDEVLEGETVPVE